MWVETQLLALGLVRLREAGAEPFAQAPRRVRWGLACAPSSAFMTTPSTTPARGPDEGKHRPTHSTQPRRENRPPAGSHRLQEIEFRKVDRHLLDRNSRRIKALVETGKLRQHDRDLRLVPGTVLTREYQGVEHRVTVAPDGQYEFEGRRYPSLSMIAREITGTRWSGPLFFGVKAPAKPKPRKKEAGAR
ncbi:MAG TPA: DUF2924 domain-containing protein [Candidatus Acidoferrales bacterium]|nr:DUF2924 domain-containing protein [Candidatus Acidoferrales bacterium]